MEDFSWDDNEDYSTDLNQDIFDAYLAQQWIDSFDVPCSGQTNTANVMEGDEDLSFFDIDSASVEFANNLENLSVACELVSEISDQPDTTSATPPLEASPAPFQLSFDVSPSRPKKRRFEDYLSEFVVMQPAKTTKNARKPFSPDGRKKAYQVRKAGACVRCRLLKTPCELELPCTNCVKTCKDPALGRSLCLRQRLIDARFTTDLWGRDHDMKWLQKHATPLYGPRKVMRICLVNFCDLSYFSTPDALNKATWIWDGGHDGPWIDSACLDIEVQDFEPLAGKEHKHNLEVRWSGGTTTSNNPEFYAIPTDCLPSLESLISWVPDTTQHSRRACFGSGFHGTFLSLALRYYECERDLPLAELMRKVVRLSCLHAIWCLALPKPRTSREQPYEYASKVVHTQIEVIVAKGIVDLEVKILSELQTLIFSTKGPGKLNMLPIWTCLWLLILTYRRTLHTLAPKIKKDNRLELAQHMYDMFVSVYSGLFRPSSPMWLNWLKDEVFELLGKDRRITHCIGTLKTELDYVYNSERDFQPSHDFLLRSLVFENEKKLGRKAHEVALKAPVSGFTNRDPAYFSEYRRMLDLMVSEQRSSWDKAGPLPWSTYVPLIEPSFGAPECFLRHQTIRDL